MIDFRATIDAAKAMWIKRFLDESPSQWKEYFENILEPIGKKFLFSCNFLYINLDVKLPKFYVDVLSAWSKLQLENESSSTSNGILWNNKHIKHNNKSFFSYTFLCLLRLRC